MELHVAKAGAKVQAPIEFTGVTTSVKPIKLENGELVASFDIAGLPNLKVKTKAGIERKATILRTKKQLLADLNGYVDADAPMEELIAIGNLIAAKRNVTLMVSAHDKGALAIVTEDSAYAISAGAQVGSEIETNSAGFYTEGFLSIDVSEARQEKRVAEMKALRLAAKAEQA